MYKDVREQLRFELQEIEAAGLTKRERGIQGAQGSRVSVESREMLNFCANNYLGLADHPRLVAAAKKSLDAYGFGMASVRFICGTQDQHLQLERKLADFLGYDDAILFSSCFDANGGVFEVLFGADDAIISDELNHASIIDGIRLSKASRYRYRNRDMAHLEEQLQAAKGARRKVIVTDGVFSMDGYFAPLEEICDLANKHDALVFVDDSHAVGFIGDGGRGTPERSGVMHRVDITTGTFGKALGGASGGYVAGHQEIIDLLRQRARPYLFSNSLAPSIVAATLEALDIVSNSGELRERLTANAQMFRNGMQAAGFNLLPGEHAIVPIMFGDAVVTATMAAELQKLGVFVTAFSYPVVPKGQARIRVQLSASHTPEQIQQCVEAFVSARLRLAV